MAIACLRLFTLPPLPPLPERNVPFFSRRIASSTLLPAAFPYFRPPLLFFFPAIIFLSSSPRPSEQAQPATMPSMPEPSPIVAANGRLEDSQIEIFCILSNR